MIVGGHSGAGRPILSWRWRLGPARFGSYRKRHRFASVSTARAAFHASASEAVTAVTGYSSSTRLFFGRPARPCIFWTTSDVRWRDIMARAGPYRRGGGG